MACCAAKTPREPTRRQAPKETPAEGVPPVRQLIPPPASKGQPPFNKPANCRKEVEAINSQLEAADAATAEQQLGRLARLLRIIEADMENGLTQREALRALHLWLTKVPSSRAYVHSVGAIELLTNAITLHPTRPAVRQYGAGCLLLLCDTTARRLTAHGCGALEALVTCLREATAADEDSDGAKALLSCTVCLLQTDGGELAADLSLRLRPETTADLRGATTTAIKKFPQKREFSGLARAISNGLKAATRATPPHDATTNDDEYSTKGGAAAAEITTTLRRFKSPQHDESDFVQWFPLKAITLQADSGDPEAKVQAVEGAMGVLVDAEHAEAEAKLLGNEGGVDLGDPVMAWDPTEEQTQLKMMMCGREITIRALNKEDNTAQVALAGELPQAEPDVGLATDVAHAARIMQHLKAHGFVRARASLVQEGLDCLTTGLSMIGPTEATALCTQLGLIDGVATTVEALRIHAAECDAPGAELSRLGFALLARLLQRDEDKMAAMDHTYLFRKKKTPFTAIDAAACFLQAVVTDDATAEPQQKLAAAVAALETLAAVLSCEAVGSRLSSTRAVELHSIVYQACTCTRVTDAAPDAGAAMKTVGSTVISQIIRLPVYPDAAQLEATLPDGWDEPVKDDAPAQPPKKKDRFEQFADMAEASSSDDDDDEPAPAPQRKAKASATRKSRPAPPAKKKSTFVNLDDSSSSSEDDEPRQQAAKHAPAPAPVPESDAPEAKEKRKPFVNLGGSSSKEDESVQEAGKTEAPAPEGPPPGLSAKERLEWKRAQRAKEAAGTTSAASPAPATATSETTDKVTTEPEPEAKPGGPPPGLSAKERLEWKQTEQHKESNSQSPTAQDTPQVDSPEPGVDMGGGLKSAEGGERASWESGAAVEGHQGWPEGWSPRAAQAQAAANANAFAPTSETIDETTVEAPRSSEFESNNIATMFYSQEGDGDDEHLEVPIQEVATLVTSGVIQPSTEVWTEGMPEWTKHGDLAEGFFDGLPHEKDAAAAAVAAAIAA